MTDNTDITTKTAAKAARIKKPNKVNAHMHLRTVLAAIEKARLNLGQLDVAELEQSESLEALYAFFLPPVPAKPKTAWDWVAKAMAKDDVRFYLNWVYVTADHITATDGHRLHRAPNTDNLAPGYYDKAGNLCHGPEYATYPDVERAIPRNLDSSRALDPSNPTPIAGEMRYNSADYTLADGSPARFNMTYIKEAVSMGAALVAAPE